jgi:hypothetical protein
MRQVPAGDSYFQTAIHTQKKEELQNAESLSASRAAFVDYIPESLGERLRRLAEYP